MSSFTSELKYKTYDTSKRRVLYQITEEFSYAVGSIEDPLVTVKVPAGYITDFASIPWPFSLVFKPDGPWAKAAVIHDFLYTDYLNMSRVIADSIFLEAMLVLKLPHFVAYLFYISVRVYQSIKTKDKIET